MSSDFNPGPMIVEHWRSVGTAAWWYGSTPLAVGVGVWIQGPTMSAVTAGACSALSGVLSAYFLQLAVQVVDRAGTFADSAPQPSPHTSERADQLQYLAANATYGMLLAFTAALVGVSAAVFSNGRPERFAVAALVALLFHLGLTVSLVGMRMYYTAIAEARDARSGASKVRSDERRIP